MKEMIFNFQRESGVSLQMSIREILIDAILGGQFLPGESLPSCRRLAKDLKVSRNTIVQVYQSLCDDGFAVSRERSGFYINDDINPRPYGVDADANVASNYNRINAPHDNNIGKNVNNSIDGNDKWFSPYIINRPSKLSHINKPANWHDYDYPFIYGQVDPSLFPIAAWRECSRQSMSLKALEQWTGDALNDDDPMLVRYIKSRLLPRRGIKADENEILITLGAQNALYLIVGLLLDGKMNVGMEEPGYPDVRNQFSLFTKNIINLPVDEKGVKITDELKKCHMIYTTPSHQYPTNVTMPMDRRKKLLDLSAEKNMWIIEDDYEFETSYKSTPIPTLKSLDDDDNVLYVGSLSKNLFPALRIGYIVAHRDIVAELRALRRLVLRHAPTNNQRTAALFLALGHHETYIGRLKRIFEKRCDIMKAALDKYLPNSSKSPGFGGTSFWVRGPKGLDSKILAEKARDEGIIIEPGHVFFASKDGPCNYFRLGFSSINENKIEYGIEKLAKIIKKMMA